MYYTKEFYDHCKKNGYIPITDVNKRRIKNPVLLKKIKADRKKYIKACKIRKTIESLNSWVHKTPKLDRVIERKLSSFIGILLLRMSQIGNNKLHPWL
jgi:hypothetical protein